MTNPADIKPGVCIQYAKKSPEKSEFERWSSVVFIGTEKQAATVRKLLRQKHHSVRIFDNAAYAKLMRVFESVLQEHVATSELRDFYRNEATNVE